LPVVLGGSGEKRHVQDPVFVGQGKAGGLIGVQAAVNALPHRFVAFHAAAGRSFQEFCGIAFGALFSIFPVSTR
jgi:hypothetical protein